MTFMKPLLLIFLCLFLTLQSAAQNFNEIHQRIKTATENKDYPAAVAELETLKRENQKVYELNNYDYLLARLAEKLGDGATATAGYEAVAARNSVSSMRAAACF